jgi:hypothetical protein
MSLKSFLSMQHLAALMSQVKQIEAKLEEHLAEDRDAIEAELKEAIAHFKEKVAQARASVDAKVLEFIDKGIPPQTAYEMAQAAISEDNPGSAQVAAVGAEVSKIITP